MEKMPYRPDSDLHHASVPPTAAEFKTARTIVSDWRQQASGACGQAGRAARAARVGRRRRCARC